VSFLQRILGASKRNDATSETETVRRIAARLERLPHDRARHLAAFAYVLARIANSDLRITETETDAMLALVREHAGLSEEEAALAVEIAKSQTRLLGGTENYVVTREFREISSREDCVKLMHCLYAVAAADGSIASAESAEIAKIADELGLLREEVLALRAQWRNKLSEFQSRPDESS
jgi:uncharacterized tellurite resistance protein B-like protein